MSDWIGVYSTTESIKAGLDLEMPCVVMFSPYPRFLLTSSVLKWTFNCSR